MEEQKKIDLVAKKHFKAALHFNDLHCHTVARLWMCPTCNKVHEHDPKKTREWGWLTGVHYPACCGFNNGHRLFYDLYATTGAGRKDA